MADEITINGFRIKVKNGDYRFDFNNPTQRIDQAVARGSARVLSIGTSVETITFTDIATEGVLILKNLDATNYVVFGDTSATNLIGKLKPGECAVLRMNPAATLDMQANTADCDVQIILLSD